jgi:hypothetical protein
VGRPSPTNSHFDLLFEKKALRHRQLDSQFRRNNKKEKEKQKKGSKRKVKNESYGIEKETNRSFTLV